MSIKNENIKGSGIYIEPVGMIDFLDKSLIKLNTNKNNSKDNVISILKSGGISSNVIPAKINIPDNIYNYLNLSSINMFDQNLQLVDGGTYYTCGITSLLQRRVKNIIFVCPVEASNIIDYDNKKMININTYLSKYFNPEQEMYIFNKKHFSILKKHMFELIKLNKSIIVQMPIEIVNNSKNGINLSPNEKYIPNITFIHPSKNEWLDKLPTDTKNYINNNKSTIKSMIALSDFINTTFAYYPFINTLTANYSIELINALSQNACYDVISYFTNNNHYICKTK